MIKKVIAFLLCVFLCVNSALADFMCYDVPNLYYSAKYVINNYTCSAGQFLPANTLGCASCPSGATCPGGNFDFNEKEYQGMTITRITGVTNNVCADNFPVFWNAVYSPNQHTCSAGYYMPANYDGCQICPENNYCPGGTYIFNEAVAHGINACPTGLVAPTGMWNENQCGLKLHLGENSLYLRRSRQTNPSLNFDTNGDGVADFYANVSTTDTVMSLGATQKFKIKVGETIYSIHDDTVNTSSN